MKILISKTELNSKKSRELIPLECINCNDTFYKKKNQIQMILNGKFLRTSTMEYCSRKCGAKHRENKIKFICPQCKKEFQRTPSFIRKSKKSFCSKPCSTFYYNTHKITGYRRSKLEIWLEKELTYLYPTLEIHYNKTNTINSELDIYIPSLKLAFELNGIFHYEPIYSEEKLKKTQNNDNRKFQACLENKIELCIIDVSKINYFKEKTSIPILKIIKKIINKKIGAA